MAVICPTVTATNIKEYSRQIERIAVFTHRIHLDFMDGIVTDNKSPDLADIWWPAGVKADVHLMFHQPAQTLKIILEHQPHMAIIHAEADGDFIKYADKLRQAGIKVGVALLAKTPTSVLKSSLDLIDHVLIFSGNIGHFGGRADLTLLSKVTELKALKEELEIGWDGGVNVHNAEALIKGGVDVLNVGGFIQHSDNPGAAYDKLKVLIEKHK